MPDFARAINSRIRIGPAGTRAGAISAIIRNTRSQIGGNMAKKNSKRREWTKTDVRELKTLAREKTPARASLTSCLASTAALLCPRCDVRNRTHDQNRHIRAGAPLRWSYGRGPLHAPVLFPHISVRTADAPRKTVYCIIHTGMAKCASAPLAPSRNGSPGLPRPPDAGRGFSFRPPMTVLPLLQGCFGGSGVCWPLV
jgi:hypothetical protein